MSLTNDHADVRHPAERLAAWGAQNALPQLAIEHLSLALDELVTNTINYGFEASGVHAISVMVWCESQRVVAEITDAGRPFDPFADDTAPDKSSYAADRKVGRLGIHLVRNIMDLCEYRRDGATNVTRIAKALSGAMATPERGRSSSVP